MWYDGIYTYVYTSIYMYIWYIGIYYISYKYKNICGNTIYRIVRQHIEQHSNNTITKILYI